MEFKSNFRRLNPAFENVFFGENEVLKTEFTYWKNLWSNEQICNFTFKSSGSTGVPKEIEFSEFEIFSSASQTIAFFQLKPQSVVLHSLPVNFVAGAMMNIRSMLGGFKQIVVMPSLRPIRDLEIDIPIDFAPFTPAQLMETLKNGTHQEIEKLKSIHQIIVGGGEINEELRKYLEKFPNPVFHTYGMTETLTHIAVKRINGTKSEDAYTIINPSIKLSLDERSCLVFEIPYLKQGKIVSNDCGEIVENEKFIWKGRFDNIINSGGLKIIPEEVEAKMKNIIPTDTFYITSKKDAVLGEKCVLVLQNIDKEKIGIENVLQKLKEMKGHYKPKEIVWVNKIEYTSTGKIKRKKF
jgi:O-succinylbenzoic acid--CoA ligase